MSIASEIERIQSAKADIKTAIENKGVTVDSTKKISEYADLIDAISTGNAPTLVATKTTSATNGSYSTNFTGLTCTKALLICWFRATNLSPVVRVTSVSGATRTLLMGNDATSGNYTGYTANISYLEDIDGSLTVNTYHNQQNVHASLTLQLFALD